jgi:hypothetical protein
MTAHNIEVDALATAAQSGNFAARHILLSRGVSDPVEVLLACIKDCCDNAPTIETSHSMRTNELLSALQAQNETLIQLSAIVFAAEADNVLGERGAKELNAENASRVLKAQAKRAREIFQMIPTLHPELYRRINLAEQRVCPDPFTRVMQVLLRKVADHWANAVEEKDATTSLMFLVGLGKSDQPSALQEMSAATLRDADSQATVERLSHAIHVVCESYPTYSSSRTTMVRNFALAMARKATVNEISQMASAFAS